MFAFSSLSDLVGVRDVTLYGMSNKDKARRKYAIFIGRTLDSFAENNPSSTKAEDDKQLSERGALLLFLNQALDDELHEEFGNIPSYTVTKA